jgi:anti-sigma regulatory factor (Ser/Thr protein kinase)
VVSVGYATFASDQLCVLTDASVGGQEIPSFVSFPLDTRMLLIDALGSSDVRILDAQEYAATYPTVAILVRRPEVVTLAAVGFDRLGVTGSVSLGLTGPIDAAGSADLQAMAIAFGDALARCDRRQRDERTSEFQRRFLHAERQWPTPLLTRSLSVPAGLAQAPGAAWHDLFELPDGRVALVVGDVTGHGVDAVIAMSRAASALRALLVAIPSPSSALDGLDRFAAVTPSAAGARCIVAVVDPISGATELSAAGHAPALVGGAGRAAAVVGHRSGPSVGAAETPRVTDHLQLAEGASRVLIGHGLLESDGDAPVAVDELAPLLEHVSMSTPAVLVAELVERCIGAAAPETDVAVVAVQRWSPDRPVFSRTVSASAATIATVRRELGAWLTAHGAATEVAAIQLAVSELMSNVVDHAYRTARGGTVVVDAEITAEQVEVAVIDDGRWSSQIVDSARGRGLTVVEQLVANATIRSTAQGTMVGFVVKRHTP